MRQLEGECEGLRGQVAALEAAEERAAEQADESAWLKNKVTHLHARQCAC